MTEEGRSKSDVIREFVFSNSHLPKQGTDEWREKRRLFVGGSEVAVLLNKNKNKTLRKLILEKMGLHTFSGNSATYWGNVFEPLIRNYTNSYFKCSIVETGSIPFIDSNLSYSPDGIAYVDRDNMTDVVNLSKLNNDDGFIVLFEFKCPHSRMPDGKVPEYYEPQPLLGMNIINICEVSIFIEAIYRRCLFHDLKYNINHVAYGHYNRTRLIDNPVEYGFITILMNQSTDESNDIINQIYKSGTKKIKGIYDLGTLYDKDIFDSVLNLAIKGVFTLDYSFNESFNQEVFTSYPYIVDDYNKGCQYRALKKLNYIKKVYGASIIGIMPYKLMNVYMNPIYKEDNFIKDNDLVNKAKKVIDFINANIDNKDEKELTKLIRKI